MGAEVEIEDVSRSYGILALQGPRAHEVIRQLTDAATSLKYFGATDAEIVGKPVMITRTGYTGDLGYELWIESEDACSVWDALMEAGSGHNITPIGTTALKMARVEAGLLLMGTDFHSSRFAWVDAQRETPAELGWSWMFKGLSQDDRPFIGRSSIELENTSVPAVGRRLAWRSTGMITSGSIRSPAWCLRDTRSTPSLR